uniref:Uncharacterized protein n=1 Tax=Timema genevievae TaxID=629358 RepID=A0A7R9PKQ7_TIMGE|nr:unnamed protein product [Timema genevievae]
MDGVKSRVEKAQTLEKDLEKIFNKTVYLIPSFNVLLFYFHREETKASPAKEEDADVEEEFAPSLLNSTVYIISMALQVATFAINYRGHPYMESLTENKALLYSIVGSAGAILALALGVFPDMAYQFEIVDFPSDVILSLALFVNMATKRKAVIQDTEILAIFIDSSTQSDQFVCHSESTDSEFVNNETEQEFYSSEIERSDQVGVAADIDDTSFRIILVQVLFADFFLSYVVDRYFHRELGIGSVENHNIKIDYFDTSKNRGYRGIGELSLTSPLKTLTRKP